MNSVRPHRFASLWALFGTGAALAAILVFFAPPPPGHTAPARKSTDPVTREGGTFPDEGRIVIRSGLSWLNENAPVFGPLAKELAITFKIKGLTLVSVPPTVIEAMPSTPLPADADILASPAPRGKKAAPMPAPDSSTQARAAELAREGKLPKLKLREYSAPSRDADLPGSVRAVRPPDVERALFALSQQKGIPIVRSHVAIPGRLPAELTKDAAVADYALVARFALMQPPASVSDSGMIGFAAAGGGLGIGGTGSLGFGPPPSPGASAPPGGYGTPGGYVRGYENPAGPNDIWHRDSDFFRRDYMQNVSPPPPSARPPAGLSPSVDGYPAQPGPGLPGRGGHVVRPVESWYLLQMECFDLRPVRQNKKPVMVWRSSAQMPAGDKKLASALPEMARAIFAAR